MHFNALAFYHARPAPTLGKCPLKLYYEELSSEEQARGSSHISDVDLQAGACQGQVLRTTARLVNHAARSVGAQPSTISLAIKVKTSTVY